jgi:hypothetical protein
MYNSPTNNLTEGLGRHDLAGFIDKVFTVDQYKSKMGADEDIVVLTFKSHDKHPAIDLMEFIEKGYPFVLDADISAGEERDGKYSIFVELERSNKVPRQIDQLLAGISQLCDIYDWRFRYYKQIKSVPFSVDLAEEIIPLSQDNYYDKLREIKTQELNAFLNKGSLDSVKLQKDSKLKLEKPYAESLEVDFIDHGDYTQLKESVSGPIQLDPVSVSQTIFLEKYLGNYEITKIDNKFLIKNGDQAILIKKDKW